MEKLNRLFEETFGHPGSALSDEEKFSRLQKVAYELGNRDILEALEKMKNSEEISLSEMTIREFEDSRKFV